MALEVPVSTPIMQTLRPSQVPEYLTTSSFFLGLNVVDDDEFSIPVKHMKLDTKVDSVDDMTELLNTIRFWHLEFVPQEIVKFAAREHTSTIQKVFEPYLADFPFIAAVCSIVSGNTDIKVQLEKAMDTGDINIVRYFHKKKGAVVSIRGIQLAAGKDAVDCLQLTIGRRSFSSFPGNCVFSEAVRNGCMDCILFLQQRDFTVQNYDYGYIVQNHDNDFAANVDLVAIAASAGQYEVLKYLHGQGCCIKSAAVAAADAGHLDCLEYAIQNGEKDFDGECTSASEPEPSTAQAQMRANQLTIALSRESGIDVQTAFNFVNSGNQDVWKLCVDSCARLSIDLIAAVAQKGNLACLEYLHQLFAAKADVSGQGLNWIAYAASVSDNGYLRPADIAQMTAAAEKWNCLGFLITHDCPMNKHLATSLVQAGQLELYYLATAHGCHVSVQAARQFAKEGNLTLLLHALAHGCERSEEILRAAARHGQLQCLIYARQQGCPWSAQVTLAAARGGHLECLQYLHEHGCPSYAHVRSACPK